MTTPEPAKPVEEPDLDDDQDDELDEEADEAPAPRAEPKKFADEHPAAKRRKKPAREREATEELAAQPAPDYRLRFF